MNVHLKGHVTTHASIIQALLNVLATKDTLSMASHIVEVCMGVLLGMFFLVLLLCLIA